MNNSDSPAMPQTWVPEYGHKPPVSASGLTKLEEFTKVAMGALIAEDSGQLNIGEQAVKYAIETLAALDKNND